MFKARLFPESHARLMQPSARRLRPTAEVAARTFPRH